MNRLETIRRRIAERQVILDKLKSAPARWHKELAAEWDKRNRRPARRSKAHYLD